MIFNQHLLITFLLIVLAQFWISFAGTIVYVDNTSFQQICSYFHPCETQVIALIDIGLFVLLQY